MSVSNAGHEIHMGGPLERTQAICDMLDDLFGAGASRSEDVLFDKAEWANVSSAAIFYWYKFVDHGGVKPSPGESRHAHGFAINPMRAYILMAKYLQETGEDE